MGALKDASRSLWQKIDIYVLVILFPLLLIAVGLWEHSRADHARTFYADAATSLAATREEIRTIAAREPGAMIDAGDRVMPASMAMAELDELVPTAERGALLSRIRAPIAVATILGGTLALLAGATGLLLSAQAGRSARRSRDLLVASFSRIHRTLPMILGALLVGIAVGLFGIAVFETISVWFWERVSGNGLKLIGIGLIFGGLAIYGAFRAVMGLREIFALSAIEPFEERGRLIDEQAAPGVWHLVRDVAHRQEATAPDAIIIGLEGGFYVTEHPIRLLPEDRVLEGRTLHLPAPHLEFFDRDELSAVIGHELAHFVGEDTAYSRHFTPIYTGLERALLALHDASTQGFALNPALRLGTHMMDSFDHAVKHWSRLREFEADRMSSIANGSRPVATSLLRSSVIGPIVNEALDRRFQDESGSETDAIGEMVERVRASGWPSTDEHLEDRSDHPTDTHPSTPHRIERLSLTLDEQLLAHATRPPADAGTTPGSTLFADWMATRRQLDADFVAYSTDIRASHRAFLEGAVTAVGDETVEIYENVRPMIWFMGIVAALFGGGAITAIAFFGSSAFSREPIAFYIIAGLCLLFAACFGLFALRLRRDGRDPVMRLTPDALLTPRLAQPLRWADTDGHHVVAGGRYLLICSIADDALLPERAAKRRRTQIDKKQRLLTMQLYGVRGMKPQAFTDLIGRYRLAAAARAELGA